jgi:hypothetical protein
MRRVLMMSRRTGLRQGFPLSLLEFVLAGIHESAAALATHVEVGAALVHLGEFLSHQPNYLETKQRLSAKELLQSWRLDESECAVALATGAECVWLRAQDCRQSDNASGTEQPLENFSSLVLDNNRQMDRSAANNINTSAGRPLIDEELSRCAVVQGRQRFQGDEEFWRQLERATDALGIDIDSQKIPTLLLPSFKIKARKTSACDTNHNFL